MTWHRRILAAIVLTLPAVSLRAAFDTALRHHSPRGVAMGDAILADPDPLNGFLYNPALASYAKELQVQSIFGLPFTGLDDARMLNVDAALVVPFTYHFRYAPVFKDLVFGFAFNRFQIASDNAWYISGDELSYAEQLFGLVFAKKFENTLGYGTVFTVGLAANIYNRGLKANLSTEENPYLKSLSKTAFGVDLGATYHLGRALVLGGVVENLIPPDPSLGVTKEPQPMTTKMGLAAKFPRFFFMKNITAAGSVWFRNWENKDDARTPPREYHLGYEFWEFEKYLGVRLGYQWSDYGRSRIRGMSLFSLGLATAVPVNSHEIHVDYAFRIPVSFSAADAFLGTFGSHSFALSWRWSWPQSLFEFDPQKREELRQMEEMRRRQEEERRAEAKDVAEQSREPAPNPNDPDAVTAQAARDRNKALLELHTAYSRQRDEILDRIKKVREEQARTAADLDRRIAEEGRRLERARPDDRPAVEQRVKELIAQKEAAAKSADEQVAELEKQLGQLKRETAAKLRAVEAEWQKVWRRNQRRVSPNFKEEPPSIDLDAFRKELEQ